MLPQAYSIFSWESLRTYSDRETTGETTGSSAWDFAFELGASLASATSFEV